MVAVIKNARQENHGGQMSSQPNGMHKWSVKEDGGNIKDMEKNNLRLYGKSKEENLIKCIKQPKRTTGRRYKMIYYLCNIKITNNFGNTLEILGWHHRRKQQYHGNINLMMALLP